MHMCAALWGRPTPSLRPPAPLLSNPSPSPGRCTARIHPKIIHAAMAEKTNNGDMLVRGDAPPPPPYI